eukprot:14467472-Heterocapsa_arctica.AAC.1
MDALLAMDFDANPLGVTVVEPVNPIPPANKANEDEDTNVDEASIAELQSGVKQNEPSVTKKRWGKGQAKGAWADLIDSETEDVPGTSTDINV